MRFSGKMLAVVVVGVACVGLAWLLLGRQSAPPETTPPLPTPTAADRSRPPAPAPSAPVAPEAPAPVAGAQAVQGIVQHADNAAPISQFEFVVLDEAPATPVQGKAMLLDTRYKWTPNDSADGTFAAAPPTPGAAFAVGVRAEGYQPAYQSIPAGETRVVVLLTAQTTVSGIVQSSDGTRVAGAAIVLGEPAKSDIVARSAPDGRFQITEMTTEKILLTAEHPDYEPASVSVIPVKDQITQVTIVVQAGGSIEGTVTRGGQPLPNAFIIVYDVNAFVKNGKTDNAGLYAIKGIPSGPVQVECQVRIEGLDVPLTKQMPVEVQQDRVSTLNFDFPAELGSVGGMVTINGQPAGGGNVRLSSAAIDGDFFANSAVQSDGTYQINNIPPGQVSLQIDAQSAAGVTRTAQLAMTLNAGEKIEQDIEIGGLGAIEGTIENAAADVSYRVLLFWGEIDPAGLQSSRTPPIVNLTADDAGRFHIDGIGGGVYTVVVMALGPDAEQFPDAYAQSRSALRTLTVEDGKTAAVSFAF